MVQKNDIYDFSKIHEREIKKLKESNVSAKNKELILNFDRICFIDGLSKPRRIKIISILFQLAEKYLTIDFDTATKSDLKEAVFKIDSSDKYSVWTRQSYRAIIKKFFKWHKLGDEYNTITDYPEIVSWIKASAKKKDLPRVKASDILTEDEIKLLIDSAEHNRDKAFISLLYELGARISEIGNLRIKDISRDKYSYIIDLVGKTGHRTPRVVISDPYLTNWLNSHPIKNEPLAPLWVTFGWKKNQKMMYASLRAMVNRLVKKTGIKKRIHPHLFRHSRATHLLLNKQINEAQAKVYFGWTADSAMLSNYSHLISSDVNNAILQMHGIKTEENTESKLKPKQCQMCSTINSYDALFCQKCGKILDVKTAIDMDEKRRASDEVLSKILKNNPKLRDELVKSIIDMGLAEKLG